jgi:hypothetical protein
MSAMLANAVTRPSVPKPAGRLSGASNRPKARERLCLVDYQPSAIDALAQATFVRKISQKGARQMSGFEFFFGFYGLILGLAMAELLGAFANIARIGRLRAIGWGTMLLGVEVAYEILIFWLAAWHNYKNVVPSISTLAVPFFSGAVYYIAAGIVFPRTEEQIADVDAYFMEHKQKVATCLLLIWAVGFANELKYLAPAIKDERWAYLFGYYLPINLSASASYVVLIFSKSRLASIGALLVLIGWFLYITFAMGY